MEALYIQGVAHFTTGLLSLATLNKNVKAFLIIDKSLPASLRPRDKSFRHLRGLVEYPVDKPWRPRMNK